MRGITAVKHWLLQVLIAIDQLGTALFGGWADETMSSYAWRLDRAGKPWGRIARPAIDLLFVWQGPGHCQRAYNEERLRAQCPPELRR
jgi:hypothetical protein